MTQWQPIETAPRDGTAILVYRSDMGVFSAHYVSPCEFIEDGDDEPGWFSTNGHDLSGNDMPTHWMPIPQPPKDQDK